MDEARIREFVADYLTDRLTLKELDSALSRVVWDDAAPAGLRALANDVALYIDEFSSGACGETELKGALSPFVTDYTTVLAVGLPPSAIHVRTALDAPLTRSPLTLTRSSADTQRAAVRA